MSATTMDVTIPTDDGPMPAAESTPGTPARGAVVVFQEGFGLNSHIREITRRLADAGWRAVAPALFHRQGSPVLAYDDLTSVGPVMQELTAGGITTDVVSTLDYLDTAGFPPARTGVVGFCMGGSVSFYAGTLRPLGAAVTFYGGGVSEGRFGLPSLIELAPSLATPWLGLYGDRDAGIPVESVENLRLAAARAPVPTELVRYAEADHGFNCDERSSYAPDAAADAWRRTLAFFDQHLG
jgi:carboxymethylenebutenolidase